MRALISGLASRAVFIEGDAVTYIDAERPEHPIPAQSSDVLTLLGNAPDIVRIDEATELDALQKLADLTARDRSLRMLQLLLDGDEVKDFRIDHRSSRKIHLSL